MWPDWKCAEAYPKQLTNNGWAWEFLRRNEDYQATWRRYLAIQHDLEESYGPEKKWTDETLKKEDVWHFDPPKRPKETIESWELRVTKTYGAPFRAPFSVGLAREWRLRTLVDPNLSAQEASPHFIRSSLGIWYHVDEIYEVERQDYPYEVPGKYQRAFVEVDMRYSIHGQLQTALKKLKRDQAEFMKHEMLRVPSGGTVRQGNAPPVKSVSSPTPKTESYQNYLRVLDAHRAKPRPTRKEIAKVLLAHYPPSADLEKAVSDMKSEARRMVNMGFLRLIS